MPRVSLYKSILVLCFLISAYCLWKSYTYFHKNEEFQHTCNMPEAYRNQLELLVERCYTFIIPKKSTNGVYLRLQSSHNIETTFINPLHVLWNTLGSN